MAQLPFFPKLRGLTWPKKETIETSTLVKKAVSGRTVRVGMYSTPIYHIELKYAGLASSSDPSFSGLGTQSLQALQALFSNSGGQLGQFLVKKSEYTAAWEDSNVQGQQLGIGDGVNTVFIFTRTIVSNLDFANSYTEPVGQVEPNGLNVYVNGTLQASSTYTVSWPNVVTFGTAPTLGSIVTADYTWYFVCAFEDDELTLTNFAQRMWSADSVKLVTVKP